MHIQQMRLYRLARLLLVALALLGAGLACNLETGSESDQPTPTVTLTALPLPFLTMTAQGILMPVMTAAPTLTPTVPAVPTQPVATVINCYPQTTWPLYTVQAGDTLSELAIRTGTTVDQLVTANCLLNAGLIYVGQQLRLPFLPPTPTTAPIYPTAAPTYSPPPNGPVFASTLTVEPHWIQADGTAITYSDAVRINAGEVYNADQVVFTVQVGGAAAATIGTDRDPYDGAFVDYNFPAVGVYTFQAIAQNNVTQAASRTFTIRYNPTFNPPSGQRNVLTITPYTTFNGGWYFIPFNTTILITWEDAPPGAQRVDFTITPTGTGTAGQGQALGSDLDLSDGAQIAYFTDQGLFGHLQAVALMPDGSTVSSEIVNVVTE